MADISFCHLASAGKKISTEHMFENVRKYYPDAFYFLASDSADDLYDINQKHGGFYTFYNEKVGYPSYDLVKLLKWFERFKTACQMSNTSHIMMMEDDVLIRKHLCNYIFAPNIFPERKNCRRQSSEFCDSFIYLKIYCTNSEKRINSIIIEL